MRRLSIIALMAACVVATSCESWFGPAEGDGIRATHATGNGASITIEGGTCGGVVRFNGGDPVSFMDKKTFRDLKPGTYQINSKACWGDTGGVWGGGSCWCGQWSYCTVTVGRGDRVVLEAGWCG